MKSPTNCQVTSRSFYAAGPRYALGPPRANIGTFRDTFFRYVLSQYIRKRRLLFKKATLLVLPRQSRSNPNLNRGKNEKRPSTEPCGTPHKAQNNSPRPLHQSHQGKIFQEASVHLRKCLSLAGLDMTIKRRRGRNFGLSCLTLSPLTRGSHHPLNTCARTH